MSLRNAPRHYRHNDGEVATTGAVDRRRKSEGETEEGSHVLFHFISDAVHCNFFREPSRAEPMIYSLLGGSSSVEPRRRRADEHLTQWLLSLSLSLSLS